MNEGRSRGYIRLHRRIDENQFLMHDANAFNVFTKLLLLVGREKGQWAGGRKQLSKHVDLAESTLYKVLKRLEREQLIFVDSNTKYSVISILKWHQYQNVPNRLNLDTGTAREQHGNTLTRTKEINNKNRAINFEEKPAAKTSPAYLAFLSKRKELKI